MGYSEIENKKQYQEYCDKHLKLGNILSSGKCDAKKESEYYILDLIIEDYHKKQINPFTDLTPVDLLKALMAEHGYNGYRLYTELKISQSVISDILNYKRGFSRAVIRKLAKKFNLPEQSFFKEYELIGKLEGAA